MRFLTANWEHILNANYAVDPSLLSSDVPEGTELDRFEGSVYVSLVAFIFQNTRVLGMPIPWHVNFEEVNLRFYIKTRHDPNKRGVAFIKEIVPRRAIAFVAKRFFGENYFSAAMNHNIEQPCIAYSWSWASKWNTFSATVPAMLSLPAAGSLHEFITEHYWGYTQASPRTLEYEVRHESWKTRDVDDFDIDVDFRAVYGERFAFLSKQPPTSVLYARGSPVSVMSCKRL